VSGQGVNLWRVADRNAGHDRAVTFDPPWLRIFSYHVCETPQVNEVAGSCSMRAKIGSVRSGFVCAYAFGRPLSHSYKGAATSPVSPDCSTLRSPHPSFAGPREHSEKVQRVGISLSGYFA
jgi:hypothetical protein